MAETTKRLSEVRSKFQTDIKQIKESKDYEPTTGPPVGTLLHAGPVPGNEQEYEYIVHATSNKQEPGIIKVKLVCKQTGKGPDMISSNEADNKHPSHLLLQTRSDEQASDLICKCRDYIQFDGLDAIKDLTGRDSI